MTLAKLVSATCFLFASLIATQGFAQNASSLDVPVVDSPTNESDDRSSRQSLVEDPISSIQFANPFGDVPGNINLKSSHLLVMNSFDTSYSVGNYSPKAVFWAINPVCYGDNLFEEPALERHGCSLGHHKQEALSATRFFGRALTAPLHRRGRRAFFGN